MNHRLYGLRGPSYVKEYKKILATERQLILEAFNAEILRAGTLTPRGLGRMAVSLRLPLTILDDCLPEITNGRYPSGTWERLRGRGVTANDIGVSWS